MDNSFWNDHIPYVDIMSRLPKNPEPELAKATNAFVWNNVQWMSHYSVTHTAANYGIAYERAVRSALWNNFGHPFANDGDVGYLPRLIEESIENGCLFNGDECPNRITPQWELVFHPGLISGMIGVDKHISAMLHSQLTSAWTMFETMAADLWIGAVNACPDPLALLRGKPKRIPHRDSINEQDQDSKKAEKQFVLLKDLNAVTKGTFNASGTMGRVLAASRRVSFITLKGIRQAYSASFSSDHDSIDNALKNTALDDACLVRNVIVHCAGIADRMYIDDCKAANIAARGEFEKSLVLDQKTVRAIIDPVVECSLSLIEGVDQWIKTHRKNPPAS